MYVRLWNPDRTVRFDRVNRKPFIKTVLLTSKTGLYEKLSWTARIAVQPHGFENRGRLSRFLQVQWFSVFFFFFWVLTAQPLMKLQPQTLRLHYYLFLFFFSVSLALSLSLSLRFCRRLFLLFFLCLRFFRLLFLQFFPSAFFLWTNWVFWTLWRWLTTCILSPTKCKLSTTPFKFYWV